ncbi:MAG: MFS transporter [Chloroflexota bacterium]|jgi:FSR family fosmidomycin resistance protein-like MFS transporter
MAEGNIDQPKVELRPSQQQETSKDNGFNTATVLTLGAAHLGHDTYTAFLAPLLPLLIEKLSIPLAAAGILASIFRAGSLMQPLIGAWADRTDTKFFVICTPTVTAICMSCLGLAPSYLALVVLLALAGLSHASFHPASAATVTRMSGRTWGKGTSIYMTGGKLGFTLGPLFIASLVTWLGLEMSCVAAIPGVFVSLLLYWRLRNTETRQPSKTAKPSIWKEMMAQRRSLLLLSGFVFFRSTAMISFSTFYPTFLTNEGMTILFAGFAMTVYQLGGAMGALGGGILSDMKGRKTTLVVSQLLSGPLLYFALQSPESTGGLAVLAMGGAMISSATPVQLALFQELMPNNRSTASGIWSLLSFEGSLATVIVVGFLADWLGLGPALGISVLASMLSIPFILGVPETRKTQAADR